MSKWSLGGRKRTYKQIGKQISANKNLIAEIREHYESLLSREDISELYSLPTAFQRLQELQDSLNNALYQYLQNGEDLQTAEQRIKALQGKQLDVEHVKYNDFAQRYTRVALEPQEQQIVERALGRVPSNFDDFVLLNKPCLRGYESASVWVHYDAQCTFKDSVIEKALYDLHALQFAVADDVSGILDGLQEMHRQIKQVEDVCQEAHVYSKTPRSSMPQLDDIENAAGMIFRG